MNSLRQINYREWLAEFEQVSDAEIEKTRYFRHLKVAPWSQYLFPPSTYALYGQRLLKKIRFDPSVAALRLWGFALSEGERIFRARQAGMKIVAVMGDLGALPPLVYSFPNTVAFYPDCLWWVPFMMESPVLFEEAQGYGLGDDCCFVRAALGAFSKKAYFPRPDLCIATVGATCDDMSAVISEAELLGNEIYYFELPLRNETGNSGDWKEFISDQYRRLCKYIEKVLNIPFSNENFFNTLKKINHMRKLIADISELNSQSEFCPMGAIEMMNAEFSALSYYGDPDECAEVLNDLKREMEFRADNNIGYSENDLRLVWITPPADPLLLNYAEKLGGRIVGTEYLINQTKSTFKTEGDPFEILAENQLQSTLIGSSDYRVNLILEQVTRTQAEGVIISGVFGSSHCPYETAPIVEALHKTGTPVLAFDVVAPGKDYLQSQIFSRMEAFMETLRARKRNSNINT
jgi:benzoyl-CoA reductase/2-hydroxyglutaryl-CoA dehydratase subunit BcrC/BadD/HgdB